MLLKKRTILKRITIILLTIVCPGLAQAQEPPACANATDFVCASHYWRGVRLEWTDNSNGNATYIIKHGEDVVATVDPGNTSYTFTTELATGTAHTYTLHTKCGDDVLEDPLTVTFTTSKGPRIDGYVCGGARMADVNGSSRVTIVNGEHLHAVYGANDIAGTVKAQTSFYGEDGYKGAEVIIGTENTNEVLIDYVYGGGSGLYYYPGIETNTTSITGGTTEVIKYSDNETVVGSDFNRTIGQDTTLRTLSANGDIKGYYELYLPGYIALRQNTFATLAVPDGGTYPSLPSVARTRVSVNSDNVYIDSLFGGAENALVGSGLSGDTSVSITINGGTIYSLFGGNNYGGFLSPGSYQHVVVNGTKTDASSSVNLGGFKSLAQGKVVTTDDSGPDKVYGHVADAHGIRYLFGGGNIVAGRNVHIEINGGQIDTLFGGGNSADVASTTIDVNVVDPLYSSFSDSYSSTDNVYDIRCLFGGNNDAHMYSVPKINLLSGGIHTLYGGGNKGVMLGGEDYADNDTLYAYTGEGSPAPNAKRSTVIESDGSATVDTIYGGGQSAGTLNDTYIHLIAGTYGTVFGGTNILGNIGYQGTDGLGRNSSGTHYAKTNILVDNDPDDDEVYIKKALFGGSNGYYMCPDITGSVYSNTPMAFNDDSYAFLAGMSTPSVWQTNIWLRGGYLEGSVYGGGNLATVGKMYNNDVTLRSEGNTKLLITGCEMEDGNRAIFGGSNYANVYGNTTINIVGDYDDFDNDRWYPYIAANIYGGNDKAGTVTGGPSRTGSYSSEASDDTKISWDSLPSYMTTENSYSIAQNHKVALNQNNAASYISIQGFVGLNRVFGGGNGAYNYYKLDNSGNPDYDYNGDGNPDNIASLTNTALFFDDKMIMPNQTSSFVDINVDLNGADGTIPYVYAGGNYASVGEDMTIGSKTFAKGLPTVWLNSATRNSVDYSASDLPEVDYIFGGNNQVDMSAVPRIYLLKGDVGEVYGGGNEGGMTGSRNLAFASSYSVPGVSTCVMVVSDESDVKSSIFGGCNVESVTNDTYVGIRRGTVTANVFGGNNISGDVPVSHVDIFGSDIHPVTVYGEVFGGGKGDYEYANNGNDKFDVNTSTTEGNITHFGVTSRPYTEVTNIRVENSASTVSGAAVTIYGNIYGGGLAGGCRETTVDINAPDGVFDCMIFGGGKGIVSKIGDANSSFDGYAQVHGAEGTTRHHAGNIHTHDDSELASTNVHIRQMKSMNIDGSSRRKAVFGGGYSGDVDGNTYVTLYETNTARIPAVYLGGVAADVTGTATGLFNGSTPADSRANIVDTIYGGNDFTGRVNVTDLTVNSGVYQHVFGAGNGDYDYGTILESSGFSALDTVPYSMDVKVVYNGGVFRGNVYGGGNMGLVGNRDMDPADMEAADADRFADIGRIHVTINDGDFRRHVFGGARGKANMNSRFFGTATGTHDNVDNDPVGKQLVYGLKQVDMYGGSVYFSLHGGSESVDDGYPFECIGPVDASTNFYKPLAGRALYGDGQTSPNSTLRPSSIVNIIGGHVRKSLYGGGYQGNIYGSVFVNIGSSAIDDSPVWTKYASVAAFKTDAATTTFAQMKPADLTISNPVKLDASVYNCADWGEAGDKAYFNTRGVFGGETNVIIDGEGYNTTGDPFYSGTDPEMTIAVNVIGTGTSTEGGDINRLIIMRNYGSYLCPKPLKALYSIQRADKVVLDNVYINLYGEQDAFESYASPNFSLNRIDTLALCNDNVLNIESPANFIGIHASLKNIADVYHLTTDIAATSPNLVTNSAVSGIAQTSENLASNDILDNQVAGDCGDGGDGCESLDVCALVPTNRGDRGRPGKYNTIIVDQGSYMKISPFIDIYDNRTSGAGRDGIDDNDDAVSSNDHDYGHVFGYTYLVAPLGTMGYVYGIFKYGGNNASDGGFVSPCTCNNLGTFANEIDYNNVTNSGPYRTWRVGTQNGLRKRSATLVANKVPDQILNWPLTSASYPLGLQDGASSRTMPANNFAYATTAIELPPAKEGNFYVVESIEIDQANGGEMRLVDEGYESISGTIFQAWTHDAGSDATQNLDAIYDNDNPETHNITFGLTMSSIAPPTSGGRVTNFAPWDECWITPTSPDLTTDDGPTTRTIHGEDCWPITSISGGTYFNTIGGYISNDVKSSVSGVNEGILPRISLTLTYNTNITNTIARDVKFRMLEYDAEGHYQGPIDVTVTITTVIRDFTDLEAPVMAMYNGGITDEYVRRINIPASFLQRDLYLEDVKWERNTNISQDRFHLQSAGTAITDNTHFSIQVSPVEMVSSTLNNHLGWYDIVEENSTIDLFKLANDDHFLRTGSDITGGKDVNYTSWDVVPDLEEHYNGTMPDYGHEDYSGNGWGTEHYDSRISSSSLHGREGIKLGTLDGRAPATLDVTLKYDGDLVYYDHIAEPGSAGYNDQPGPLAWAYLKLHWYNTSVEKEDDDNDGVFWVKVKLRTREKGDTIYMAPGTTLTRQRTGGSNITVRSWNHPSYAHNQNIEQYADDIRNNPDMYVNTFVEALRVYQEGDVLDIMETIEMDGGSPVTVGNNDYIGLQVIRYSGSHSAFPSFGCANNHAMVSVKNGGRLALRNVQFNGSGATRSKSNGTSDRLKAIYFAEAPIFHCDNGGQISFNEKVSLINNYNKASLSDANAILGGAVAVTNGGIVNMGNNTEIRDNMVVEHATVDNYGGAVYVNGGMLRVGPQVDDGICTVRIADNYYYKGSDANVFNAAAPAGFLADGDYIYKLNATPSASLASTFSLSNVYLTRTPSSVVPTGDNAVQAASVLKVRGDDKNDRILFTGALVDGSSIGVSKWFPGYIYTNSDTHPLYNTVPRDTVSIAVLTGSTKAILAEENYTNNIFFNDSNYFAQTNPEATSPFATSDNYTTYHGNSGANPAYNDQVYTFYHSYLDDYNIYFQRCASFGKGVTKQPLAYTVGGDEVTLSDYGRGDSLAFLMNPDATCFAISDTLIFKVGGGFFPYNYHWDVDSVINASNTIAAPQLYRKGVRDRHTYDPNSISNFDVDSYAAKRRAAENDTLVLYSLEERQTELQSTYFFHVTADDVTGRCAVSQPIMVRVVKNVNNSTMADVSNFLLHGVDYQVPTPGVDSSGFQDDGAIAGRLTPSGSSTVVASYMVPDPENSNAWIADPAAPASNLYASNLVPRYMRTYLTFTVEPQVMPADAALAIGVNSYTSEGGSLLIPGDNRYCPGSTIFLSPRKINSDSNHWEYMSWDFDPSSGRNTTFVVGTTLESNRPTVYYAPGDYWWQVVRTYYNDNSDHGDNTASKLDYVTDYYGDVTIKTKKGLAWLISVVNGYNGQSAHTFHFNTITIDPSVSETELDMAAHKWTPIGNQNHPFEGTFVGNGKTVSNLIVNENSLPLVGMFGYTDSASISNLTLTDVQMKGNSYIGSLIGHANETHIEQVDVKDGILFSEYVAGGLVGKSEDQTYILNCTISQETGDPLAVKGNAIYFGGIGGEASWTTVINPVTNNIKQDYLSALYSSPYLGTSVSCTTNVAGKQVMRNEIHNGYAHIKSTGNAERLGGLVGRAEALNLYNCYVYGEAKATEFTGALAGYVGSNVDISNCYYVDGLSNQVVGYGTSSSVHKSSAFHGRGKQVLLNDRVDGYNNLLRALNGWVNAQNNPVYKHWRPAVGNENGGYPLFGDPEVIEVFDTFAIAACDSYDLDGITLTQSGTYTMHFVDPDDYLDSTVTIMLTVNYGDTVEVYDTVLLGQPYEGYGITLSADQVREAFGSNMDNDVATMMYIDSLLNANGCDSLVMLTLYIVNNNTDIDNSQSTTNDLQVRIYPNPTRGMVTVEGSGLLSVEVYDNISRRVLNKSTDGKAESLRFDMSQQASGSYYIRVKTSHGTVVKKLIKK